MVDNRLLVQLVNLVFWKESVEPEDYRVLELPVVWDEALGNKTVRWIITVPESLVELEALANLDHGRSPPSMQRHLGG